MSEDVEDDAIQRVVVNGEDRRKYGSALRHRYYCDGRAESFAKRFLLLSDVLGGRAVIPSTAMGARSRNRQNVVRPL